MQIRKAKIKDVTRIAEMGVDFCRYLSKVDSYFESASDARKIFLDYFRKAVYSGNKLLLVAAEDGKIIGFALAKLARKAPIDKRKRFGFIEDVYVEKKYRGSGIAGNFLEEIFTWFQSKKIKDVELYVLAKNKLARDAWKKYGFREYTLRLRKKI